MILPKRIWKDIEGFEGQYQVSNLGEIKILKSNKKKKLKYSGKYVRVNLTNDTANYTKYVHRLVAQAFLPNPFNYKEVNHKDENKANNCVWNLEWCDRSYNNSYGTLPTRRREAYGMKIKNLTTEKVYLSIRDASNDVGISRGCIYRSLESGNPDYMNNLWVYYKED